MPYIYTWIFSDATFFSRLLLNMLMLLINSVRGKRVPGLCLPASSYSNNMLLWAGFISLKCFVEEATVEQTSMPVFVIAHDMKSGVVSEGVWQDDSSKRGNKVKSYLSGKYPAQSLQSVTWALCLSKNTFFPILALCACVTWSWSWDSVPFRFWFIAEGSRNRPALSGGPPRNCDVWQVLLRCTLLYQSINSLHTTFKCTWNISLMYLRPTLC